MLNIHAVTSASSGFSEATVFTTTVLLVRLAFSTMVQFCTGFPVPSLSTPEIFTVILFHQ
ncbi:hypothetical protein AVR70_00190 [Escherichia coli]|nr:hypothetical protein AVR70_00190 [Escherichia coli]